MPLDLVSLGMGFTAGVAATAVAWNLTQRTVRNPEATKLTAVWALSEVARGGPPAIMAERIEGLEVPANAKVLVPLGAASAVPVEVLQSCEVRMHPDVRMNYALGRDRALVFSSFMHPRAHAVYTREESAVKKLQAEFTKLWTEAEPYVERVSVEAVASRDGRHVEFTGTAAEMIEYRGRKMLRVSENGHSVGVVTTEGIPAELAGKPVRVAGRVAREGGYVYVEARRIERATPRQAAAAVAAAR